MKRSEQEIQAIKNKHPLFPEKYIPRTKKRSSNPTSALANDIIAFVESKGGFAFKVATTGLYHEGKGKFIKSAGTPGTPDLIACFDSLFIGIELKRGKDRMRDSQIRFMEAVKRAKGNYIIVSSMESFEVQFNAIINAI